MRLLLSFFRRGLFLPLLPALLLSPPASAVSEDMYRPLTFYCYQEGTRFNPCFSNEPVASWKKPYEDLTVSFSSPSGGKVWYEPTLMYSDDPLTFSASAVYKLNSSTSYKGALKLAIRDLDQNFLCENTGATVDVKATETVTLSVNLVCETKLIGRSFSGKYYLGGEAQIALTLIRDGRDSPLEYFYSNIKAEGGETDAIFTLDQGAVPPDLTPLLAGSKQTFTATVQYLSTTRSKALIDFVLSDDTGKVVAALPTRIAVNERAKAEGDLKTTVLSLRDVTIPGNVPRVNLRAVLLAVDGKTDLAPYGYPLRYPVKRECTLGGRLYRQSQKGVFPLPGAVVELWDVSRGNQTQLARVVSDLKGTLQSPDCTYCFKDLSELNPTSDYQLRVRLQDGLDVAKARFLISRSLSATYAHDLRWATFKGSEASSGTRDLNADTAGNLLVDGNDTNTGPAAAEIWWHLWRAVNLMLPVDSPVSLSRNLPLEVYLNGAGSYYCKDAGAPVCPTPSCISLQKDVDAMPGANPTVIWHEFGHHLVTELYGGSIPRPAPSAEPMYDRNHNGFANDYTSDSLDEGIATFWAGITSRVFENGKIWYRWNSPTPETASPLMLELNYRSVEQGPTVAMAPTNEEYATAGVLVDLVDSGADSEPAGNGMARDELQLDPKDVLTIFKDSKPKSVGQFYRALVTKFPLLASPEPGGKPSLIDQIFLMHFFFKDSNADWKWQSNEEVGKAANGARWNGYVLDMAGTPVAKTLEPRLNREDLPQVPGSYIFTNLVDASGNRVESADLDVTFEFGSGVEGQQTTERVRAVNGQIYLQMPPPHYDAQAVISIPDSDSQPLVVRNSWYWQAVGKSENLLEHTFVVPNRPVLRSLSPASAEGGTLVELSGENFAASATGNAVFFGTIRADIISGSETWLTVAVPEYLPAGTVDVTITAGDKTSEPATFTVLAPSQIAVPSTLDFGTVASGKTSDRNVTIRNTGTAALKLVAWASTNPRFSVSSPALPATVPASGQLDLTVRFSPAAPGSQSGSVVIATSDRVKRPASIGVAGSGGAPEGPDIDVNPGGLDFGKVSLQKGRSMSLTVRNTGTTSLSVSSVNISPAVYSVVSPSVPFSVPAGGQQTVEIRFTPLSTGTVRGTSTFSSSDPDESPLALELVGEGVPSSGTSPEELFTDDGSAETGHVEDGIIIVNRLTPSAYPARLKSIRVYMAQFTGLPGPAGASITLMAFLDPSGSAAPQLNNPVLVVNQTVMLPALPVSGRGYVDFEITDGPVISSGDLYVGFRAPIPTGGVGFPLDTGGTQRDRGYYSQDGGKTFRGPLVLVNSQGAQTQVNVMTRAVVEPVDSASTCTYSVTPAVAAVPASASTTVVTVGAPSGCSWALSGLPFWITASQMGGTGNGTTVLSATPNDSAAVREAAVSVASLSVRVRQEGASTAAEQAMVPILLSSQGTGGSYYTSELTLTNRGTESMLVEAEYSPAFGGGAGAATDVVPAGGQVTFSDALGYLSSLGVPIPGSGNRGGTLRIRPRNGVNSRDFAATVRTTTAVPEGRAGLAYSEIAHGRGLTETVYLCGLRQNEEDRANVALINAGKPGAGDVLLRLTVISGDPTHPGERTFDPIGLAPGEFKQITQVLNWNGLDFVNGYVKIERIQGTAPFYAYAVINDQGTSDGSYLPPVVSSTMRGRRGLTIPVMVETSSFASELIVTNWSRFSRTLRLRFVSDAVTTSDRTAQTSVSIRAGEQLIIPEFVKYLRDRSIAGIGPAGPGYAGALFIDVEGGDGDGVFAGARTSSPGGKGRYGLFYPGVPYGTAATRSAWLFGLAQNALTRSNFAFINTAENGEGTDYFRIEIFDGATGKLVKTLDGEPLAPRQWKQISQILKGHAPGTSTAYIRVTHISGQNPFIVYAVLNDGGQPGERTGDGAFLSMSNVDE